MQIHGYKETFRAMWFSTSLWLHTYCFIWLIIKRNNFMLNCLKKSINLLISPILLPFTAASFPQMPLNNRCSAEGSTMRRLMESSMSQKSNQEQTAAQSESVMDAVKHHAWIHSLLLRRLVSEHQLQRGSLCQTDTALKLTLDQKLSLTSLKMASGHSRYKHVTLRRQQVRGDETGLCQARKQQKHCKCNQVLPLAIIWHYHLRMMGNSVSR